MRARPSPLLSASFVYAAFTSTISLSTVCSSSATMRKYDEVPVVAATSFSLVARTVRFSEARMHV